MLEGHFRADLYHRLAVVILDMPPLRERGPDILLLAQHFLRQYAEAHGLPPRQVSHDAAAWLQDYGWSGNVRELSHLMERVTLLSTEVVVTATVLEQLCLPRPLLAGRAEPPPVHGEAAPLDDQPGYAGPSARRAVTWRGRRRSWGSAAARYAIGCVGMPLHVRTCQRYPGPMAVENCKLSGRLQ